MSTEVTSQNWFQRMGNAIGGVVFGILLFLIAGAVLFWNEGRSVHTAQSLAEGAGKVVSVQSDAVKSENNGKLIHFTGQATTDESLSDAEFEVTTEGSLQLKRKVEMYQWKENVKSETRKKLGGGEETVKTYTYEKVWDNDRLDSSDYHDQGHDNPQLPFESKTITAEKAHVGAFQLGGLASKIDKFETLKVENEDYVLNGTRIFFGPDANPKIGDTRVSFEIVKPCDVSVVAVQSNDALEPYTAKAGDQIYELQLGTVTAQQMFKTLQDQNNMMTWVIRFVGWLMMFIGLAMVLAPLSVMADIIPFLGDLVGMGTGIVAFLIASASAMVVIGVAWIAYRPLLGIGLLAVAGACIFFVLKGRKKS